MRYATVMNVVREATGCTHGSFYIDRMNQATRDVEDTISQAQDQGKPGYCIPHLTPYNSVGTKLLRRKCHTREHNAAAQSLINPCGAWRKLAHQTTGKNL